VESRSRRWLGVVLSVAAIGALAVGAMVALRGGDGADEPAPRSSTRATGDDATGLAPTPVAQPAPAVADELPPGVAAPTAIALSIASKPSGAEVFRAADGVLLGTTPFEIEMPRGDGEAVFLLKKSRYRDERVALRLDGDVLHSTPAWVGFAGAGQVVYCAGSTTRATTGQARDNHFTLTMLGPV
jgi:hypothetical protein